MELIVDSADVKAIEKVMDYFPIDGVTTNPSILSKSGKKPYEALQAIRSLIGEKPIHVQVLSETAEEIAREAEYIYSRLGQNTFVKIPVTKEGVKAIKMLKASSIPVTATTVYTLEQAYLAAKAGAVWVAPYINRIEMIGGNGAEKAIEMQRLFDANGYPAKILGASFKRVDQITELAKAGIPAATIAPDLLLSLLDNPYVSAALADFHQTFQNVFGKGITMLNAE